MKTKQFLSKAIVVLLLIGGVSLIREKSIDISDIALDNVEALAAGEGHTQWYCLGSGSLNCPNGTKVEFIVDNYSFD